jgi:DNA-binding response OmpR family regulator
MKFISKCMLGNPLRSTPLILIVDDDVQINLGLQIRLRSQGYECIEARNGQEGLQAAQVQLPDVILADIRMPVMDGLSMLRELSHNAETSSIPVIIITANTSEKTKADASESGAFCTIDKPFSFEKLLQAVEKALHPSPLHQSSRLLKEYS